MKKRFTIILPIAITFGLIAAGSVTAQAQDFKVCKSKFALCTVAWCDPIPGNGKQVSCHCTVNTGYSAGQEPCQTVKETPEGQQVRSRYSPVKSYAICSNDRPWAWCLDKPCIIDKNNPEAAACACDVVRNLGDYVIGVYPSHLRYRYNLVSDRRADNRGHRLLEEQDQTVVPISY
jgi:hypothetical protein